MDCFISGEYAQSKRDEMRLQSFHLTFNPGGPNLIDFTFWLAFKEMFNNQKRKKKKVPQILNNYFVHYLPYYRLSEFLLVCITRQNGDSAILQFIWIMLTMFLGKEGQTTILIVKSAEIIHCHLHRSNELGNCQNFT